MTLSSERRRADIIDAAGLAVVLGLVVMAAFVAFRGPEGPLPMHFDLSGEPDRWGDRAEAAWVLGGMAALLAGLLVLIRRTPAAKADAASRQRTGDAARVILIIVFALAGALGAALGLGKLHDPENPLRSMTLVAGFLALVLTVVGAALGKSSPNPYLGVRVYWTFRSRLAWDKANRLLGRIYFFGGLGLLFLLPLLAPGMAMPAALVLAVGGAVISVFESWRVWRGDPDRTA